MTTKNILTIAGSDSSGGAGIQADIKAISALGGYAMSAITVLTAQNTQGVREIEVPPVSFLKAQLDAIHEDVRIDAVKIGMLANAQVIDTVIDWLKSVDIPIVVLDTVMVATSGDVLLDKEAQSKLLELIPLTSVITPNLPEVVELRKLYGLSDMTPQNSEELIAAAVELAKKADIPVIAKGGHLTDEIVIDALVMPDGYVVEFDSERLDTNNTHGTGCSLSSAMATIAAQHSDDEKMLEIALEKAKAWLHEAIFGSRVLEVGSGNGPVNHMARVDGSYRLSGKEELEFWWMQISEVRKAIDELDFIKRLSDGSLEQERFVNYQVQDALYLQRYSRTLATASALAPTREAQAFWAKGAEESITVEMELHDSWIPKDAPEAIEDEVTLDYTNHLLAQAQLGNYEVLIAALLPCYWLYQDIGERLVEANHEGHTYESWLSMYGDPAFAEATEQAKGFVIEALNKADDELREKMFEAFFISSVAEFDFFDR